MTTFIEQRQEAGAEKFKDMHVEMFKGRLSPLYVDKQIKELIADTVRATCAEIERRVKDKEIEHYVDDIGREICLFPLDYCTVCSHNNPLEEAIMITKEIASE